MRRWRRVKGGWEHVPTGSLVVNVRGWGDAFHSWSWYRYRGGVCWSGNYAYETAWGALAALCKALRE